MFLFLIADKAKHQAKIRLLKELEEKVKAIESETIGTNFEFVKSKGKDVNQSILRVIRISINCPRSRPSRVLIRVAERLVRSI